MKINIEKIRDRVQRSTGERVSIQAVSALLEAVGIEQLLDHIAELEYLDSEAKQGAELAEEEIARLRHSLMLVTQERDELRNEAISLVTKADDLHKQIRQLEEQLDSERAANEQLTHDCEIARQHLLKAISEKDNGHV